MSFDIQCYFFYGMNRIHVRNETSKYESKKEQRISRMERKKNNRRIELVVLENLITVDS